MTPGEPGGGYGPVEPPVSPAPAGDEASVDSPLPHRYVGRATPSPQPYVPPSPAGGNGHAGHTGGGSATTYASSHLYGPGNGNPAAIGSGRAPEPAPDLPVAGPETSSATRTGTVYPQPSPELPAVAAARASLELPADSAARASLELPADSAPRASLEWPAVVAARASVALPAVATPRASPELTADDESLGYVEGRPGQELAEDLADQRRRELPTARDAEKVQDANRRVMPLWQELPLLLIVSFCVAVLVRSFLVQAFVIPSSSMEETLLVGDRVLVNKIVYTFREPHRGEVIVFRGTDRWAPENIGEAPGGLVDRIGDTLGDLVGVSRPGEKDFIKRVIGVPGDRVKCCDVLGRVTVNGVGIDEPYLFSNNPLEVPLQAGVCGPRRFAEVVVPPGELFVMGDNRAVSQDSRCQGTVPIENVVGRAFFRVWPPSHWGGIGTAESFSGVPPP